MSTTFSIHNVVTILFYCFTPRGKNNGKIGNVIVRKRNGKYEYRFEIEPIDGKRRWKTRGGFTLKREALKAGEQAREEYYNTGGRPLKKQDNISFNTLSKLYLDRILNRLEPTSYSIYRTYFDKYFCPELGKQAVKDINYFDIESLLQKMLKLGYSQTWIRNAKTILNEVFDFAIKPLRIIKENPVELSDLVLRGKESEERIPYTREQINQIFDYVPNDNLYRIVLVLGIYCGMRIGEILGLTWDCIDYENETIQIDKQMANVRFDHKAFQIIKCPKSKKSIRTIHMCDTVMAELLKVRQRQEEDEKAIGEEYLYPQLQEFSMNQKKVSRVIDSHTMIEGNQEILLVCRKRDGGHIQSRAVDVFMKTLSKRMGFHTTSHIGRHTHATLLLEEGANIVNISARLGHNGTDITMHYLHSSEEADINMAKSIEETLAMSTK